MLLEILGCRRSSGYVSTIQHIGKFVYLRMKSYSLICFIILFAQTLMAQGPYYIDHSAGLPNIGASGACMDVAVGDLDKDGDLDVLLAGEFQTNAILLNDGAGNFTNVSSTNLPQPSHDTEDIAIIDINQDSALDIVFVSEDDAIHEIYINDGTAHFSAPGYSLPNSVCNAVAAADLNGDDYPDLILGNAGQNRIYINQLGNGFVDETSSRLPMPALSNVTQDLKLVDIDMDSDLDLLAGNEDGNKIYINDGNGVFSDETTTRYPFLPAIETRKVELADVDGDQDLDMFLSNVQFIPTASPQNRLLINNGSGFFTDQTSLRLPADSEHTLDGIFVDIDLDNDLDLVTANFPNRPFKAFLNNGSGFFAESTNLVFPFVDSGDGLGVLATDLNGDDLLDLYFCDRGGKDHLWLFDPASVGVEEDFSKTPFQIFPNPVLDEVKIVVDKAIHESLEVHFFTINGDLIFSESFASGFIEKIIPLSDFTSGIYIVQLSIKERVYRKKMWVE